MNIGFYISSLSQHDQLQQIAEAINKHGDNKKFNDASIFYDNVAFNPFTIKCGIFNSTDIWNFHGKLVTTSISATLKCLNIVNNIEIYYYYGWEEKINPLPLIKLNNSGVKFISKNEAASQDLFRKTGVSPSLTKDTFSELLESME